MNTLTDLLSTLPDALASPITDWHRDELTTRMIMQREENAHKERIEKMRLESKEKIARSRVAVEFLRTLQIAMETGNMDRWLGESLKNLPQMYE